MKKYPCAPEPHSTQDALHLAWEAVHMRKACEGWIAAGKLEYIDSPARWRAREAMALADATGFAARGI